MISFSYCKACVSFRGKRKKQYLSIMSAECSDTSPSATGDGSGGQSVQCCYLQWADSAERHAVQCRDYGGRAEGRAEQPGGQSARTRVHASEERRKVVLLKVALENTWKQVEIQRTQLGVTKNKPTELEERKCRYWAQASDIFVITKEMSLVI